MMNDHKSPGTIQQNDSNLNENNSIMIVEESAGNEENKQLGNDAEIADDTGNVAIDEQQGKLEVNEDEKESLEEIEEEEEAPIIVKDDSQAEEMALEKMFSKDVENDFIEVKDSSAEVKPENEVNDYIEISSNISPTKDEEHTSEEIELIERQSACNLAPKIEVPTKHQPSPSKVSEKHQSSPSKAAEKHQSSPSKMAEKHQSSSSKVAEKPQPTKPASQSEEQSDLASSIWIRNITSSTKATDLKALFSKHGRVLKAKIFTTKNKQNPTCFGYVTLTDPETADLCIENANRLNFKGRVIHVEKADRSNLSQINKNSNNSSGQSQQPPKINTNKSDKNQRKSPESAQQKSKTQAVDPKRLSTTSSGAQKRPRITAAETTKKDRESGSSSNWKAPSYHSSRGGGRYENESRSRVTSSTYASSRRPPPSAGGRTTDYGHAYKTPTEHSSTAADQQYRRIVQTSKGVRVTTYPYSSRSSRMPEVDTGGGFRSSSSHHGGGSSSNHHESSSSADKDREEMLRLMRRREEEHRKKEEELRLEREREKLKYEREKLEREKLELETYKLHAQLAQAAHLQITGLPAAAALTAPAAALIGSSAVVHNPFIQQPPQQQYHRTGETGSSTAHRNESAPAKDERKGEKRRPSKDETSSSRRHYDSSTDDRDRRNVSERGRDGRSKRSRSRSPHRRQESSRGRGGKSDRTTSTSHRDQRGGVSRYDRLNEGTSPAKRGIGDVVGSEKHPQSQRNDDQYNSKSGGGFYYGAGAMPPGRNFGDQQKQIRSDRRSSPVRTREFFAGNDRFGQNSAAKDIFNPRTDPTYASRIGGGTQTHQPTRAAEELLGSAGFGLNLQQRQDDHYIVGQQQYRREPIVSGGSQSNSQFFQTPNPNWDSPNKTAATSNNARPYITSGSAGVWNSGGWDAFGAGTSSSSQQGQSASGGRFQSYGKPGNSYSTSGRRY